MEFGGVGLGEYISESIGHLIQYYDYSGDTKTKTVVLKNITSEPVTVSCKKIDVSSIHR